MGLGANMEAWLLKLHHMGLFGLSLAEAGAQETSLFPLWTKLQVSRSPQDSIILLYYFAGNTLERSQKWLYYCCVAKRQPN